MSRSKERIGWWKARPAPDLSIVLVLATLSLAVGRAEASGGIRVEANLRYESDGIHERLVEVPRGGLEVELWSHPGSGAAVRPGQRIELFFEANADCYVTVVSVDPSGRARRLFPARDDDGWVQAGCVYRLPDPHDRTDLVVTGPRGEERVFALASLEPMRDRYPGWWHDGPGARVDYYEEDCFFRTGWVLGDPVYEFGIFCDRVVPHPARYDTYSSAWITFRVGGWKPAVTCCSVCGGILPGGRGDVCVEIHWYDDHGRFDFRARRKPVFLNASCVCDSRPKKATQWVHTASGWERRDDPRRADGKYRGDDRRRADGRYRDEDRYRTDGKHREEDRYRADGKYRGDDRHYADDRRGGNDLRNGNEDRDRIGDRAETRLRADDRRGDEDGVQSEEHREDPRKDSKDAGRTGDRRLDARDQDGRHLAEGDSRKDRGNGKGSEKGSEKGSGKASGRERGPNARKGDRGR